MRKKAMLSRAATLTKQSRRVPRCDTARMLNERRQIDRLLSLAQEANRTGDDARRDWLTTDALTLMNGGDE